MFAIPQPTRATFRFIARPRLLLTVMIGVAATVVLYVLPLERPRHVLPSWQVNWGLYYSPDSQRLVTIDIHTSPDVPQEQRGAARLWNADTGELIAVLEEGQELVSFVAFSPDSGRVAASYEKGDIRLWINTTSELLGSYRMKGWEEWRSAAALVFSPDGRLLMHEAAGSRMWDVQTGQEAFDFKHLVGQWHTRTYGGSAGIVLGCSDETVRTVRLATGELLADFPLPGPNLMVVGSAMSVDGRVLLARLASRPGPEDRLFGGNRSGPVSFWERAGEPARPFPQVDAARDFVFSADGRWVAAHFIDAPAGWRDWLLRRGDQPKHTIGVYELGTG